MVGKVNVVGKVNEGNVNATGKVMRERLMR